MLRIQYQGGVIKHKDDSSKYPIEEKFLLFILNNGKEVHFHQMHRLGLVGSDLDSSGAEALPEWIKRKMRSGESLPHNLISVFSRGRWLLRHPYVKIFLLKRQFGRQPLRRSFYLKILDDGGDQITIRSFLGYKSKYSFFAPHARFLTIQELRQLLPQNSTSLKIAESDATNPLPVVLQNEIVTRTPNLQTDQKVRQIRI